MKGVCPQCGHAESRRGVGAERECQACGTRFTPSTPLGERLLFALVFLVPGLVFAALSIGIVAMLYSSGEGPGGAGGFLGCSGTVGVLALICFIQGFRELFRQPSIASAEPSGDAPDALWKEAHSPLVPQEQAEELVREIATKHQAKGILRALGNLPARHVDNAAAGFARQIDEDETPLVLLDLSVLRNGKRGLLLTNRALYSSFRSRPLGLADILGVSYVTPDWSDYLSLWFLSGLSAVIPPLALYLWFNFRQFQARLLVNDKTFYAGGQPLRGAFWVELLTALAEAARQARAAESSGRNKPAVVVLETTSRAGEDAPLQSRQIRNPTWHEVEQSIRALDQERNPSLRIWAGEVEQASALDILGGNGKYVLRELGDGWIYYDPGAGEEEIEVCTGIPGHRAPAYYVCTDLPRVLDIARHYCETGTPE